MTLSHDHSSHRMSMIVRHGDTAYLSGQTAGSPDADASAQMEACLAKTDALLTAAGSNRARILSALIHLKDMSDFGAINAVWDRWVADVPKPARTCVQAAMARPEVLVEVTLVAAMDKAGAS